MDHTKPHCAKVYMLNTQKGKKKKKKKKKLLSYTVIVTYVQPHSYKQDSDDILPKIY